MSNFLSGIGISAIACLAASVSPLNAQNKRAMTFEDFANLQVVGAPQLSPDGKSVIYSVRSTNLEANSRSGATYKVGVKGGIPVRFPAEDVTLGEATWSPDGSKIAYTAGGHLWVINADGGGARQLSKLHGGASGPIWAPSGDRIAFVSNGYPECKTDECNIQKAKEKADNPVKAVVTDKLMFRHWNQYANGTRSHLYVVDLVGGAPVNVTNGADFHVPPAPFGGSEAYRFSPDGKFIAFTAKNMGREEAWTTNTDIYLMAVTGGEPGNITFDMKGSDYNPVFSPDGKSILFGSMKRPGFESDQHRLMLFDRTSLEVLQLVPDWDRDSYSYFYSPDGKTIYIQTVDVSRNKLYAIQYGKDGWDLTPKLVLDQKMNTTGFSISSDGKTLAWLADAVHSPGEIYSASLQNGRATGITKVTSQNSELLSQLDLPAAEEFWFEGHGKDSVQGFIVKPPDFQKDKKYPVLLAVHGGPQVPFLDSWHQRWNFAMFAAAGYGVVFINPTGSPGYGQKFVDAVTRDWGGAPYRDLMLGISDALEKNSWMDEKRLGAAGGSYGGYMVNWINGNTNRFKALISHCGVYNLESMYGATEEVWFTEWEFGGPYWNEVAMNTQYRKWSPHLYAGSMKTPTLVIHGELDYRVPVTEGISLFTALQRQNVDSKLILFPDEGHWVTKPLNQKLWYGEFAAWLDKYLK